VIKIFFKILIIWAVLPFMQQGSLLNNSFEFQDGIYLDFKQVRTNSPIKRSQIITQLDKTDFDFYEKLLKQEYITFTDSTGSHRIESDKIWGFSDQGTLFINWRGDYAKILTKGFLGYFVATEKVTYYQTPTSVVYYDTYPGYPQTTHEMRQYIINFATGEILDFSPKSLLLILEKYDPDLYKEYQKLSRRKRKKELFLYLRKFNEKHKIIIPQR